jgi:peptide/nickel transport system substrate-binding protein
MLNVSRYGYAIAILSLFIVGCAVAPSTGERSDGGRSSDPARSTAPKRITAAIRGDPPTLSKTLNTIIPGTTVLEQLVSAGLAIANDQGVLIPQLATSVPTVENGQWKVLSDGRMETTWEINPKARWHDGAPFTVDDLIFTITVSKDRELGLFANPVFGDIEGVEAGSPSSARVSWRKPFIRADALFTHDLALPLPRHLLERAYVEEKTTFTEQPYWSQDFVGSGPFKVHEWVKGSHVVLAAFGDYALGRPKLDEITVKFISDGNTIMANVLAGTIDLTIGERNFSLEEALQVRDQWREGTLAPGDRSVLMAFPQLLDPTPALVTNLQFRRALVHGIDRQELVNTFQAGLTSVAHAYLSPDLREYAEVQSAAVVYDYDPRRAGQMIEELGHVKGSDGMYRDSVGNRLAVEVRTTTLSENNKVMLSVADYWTRLGVAGEPHTVPLARSQDVEYRATFPGFEIVRQGNGMNIITNEHSAGARLPDNGFRAANTNYPRYMSPELDALVERYMTTIPWGERMEAMRQIVRHLTDGVVAVGLMYSSESNMASNRLENVSARRAWNAQDWNLK